MNETPEIFNPFGCFLLKHQVPSIVFTALETYIEDCKTKLSDDQFVDENNFSDYLAGKNSYQIKLKKEFCINSNLDSYLLSIGEFYLKNMQVSVTNYRTGTSWINYSYKGDYNPLHLHDSLLSGVIYIKQDDTITEEMRSESNFRSMHSNPGSTHFVYDLKNNPLNKFTYVNNFKKGELIMFPSWLSHWVNPFNCEGERITVAFNLLGDY